MAAASASRGPPPSDTSTPRRTRGRATATDGSRIANDGPAVPHRFACGAGDVTLPSITRSPSGHPRPRSWTVTTGTFAARAAAIHRAACDAIGSSTITTSGLSDEISERAVPFTTSHPSRNATWAADAGPRTETSGRTPSARASERQRTRWPKPRRAPADARNRTRSSGKALMDSLDHTVDLRVGEGRRERQRQGLVGHHLGDGELPAPEPEALPVEGVQVQCTEVDAGGD